MNKSNIENKIHNYKIKDTIKKTSVRIMHLGAGVQDKNT